jgi:hypothetical protein
MHNASGFSNEFHDVDDNVALKIDFSRDQDLTFIIRFQTRHAAANPSKLKRIIRIQPNDNISTGLLAKQYTFQKRPNGKNWGRLCSNLVRCVLTCIPPPPSIFIPFFWQIRA